MRVGSGEVDRRSLAVTCNAAESCNHADETKLDFVHSYINIISRITFLFP